MAEAVVSFVVGRVGDLLIQEAIFLGGVSEKVEQMQTELKRMQRFLKDADKRQDEEESVKGWISEIREVAYDAQDVIETFTLEVASRRQKGFRNKCKRYATIFIEVARLYKVGNEIEAISTRIANLTRSLQTYGIRIKEGGEGLISVFKRQRELRRTYSHLVEEFTVGLENNTELLVRYLMTEEKQGQIVSICGMGGLGKTTLANKVYHHNDVRSHFDCFAWACITQEFQTRDVWEGILINLVSPSKDRRDEISKMRDEEIAKELYQVQQKKKCLVILDDIWRVESWNALKPAFPIEKVSSKIVLTTRNKAIALHLNPRRVLEPQCLTKEESWELLQKKAFFAKIYQDFEINRDMEDLGRKMVGRCAGLPLAINVLGGILATKDSLNEWRKVDENIDFYFSRGEGYEQEFFGVQTVLGLSYHELPYQLKPCFLYLGHFSEDYEIPTKELLRLWLAEGFVPKQPFEIEEKQTAEDIAELYLHELINRCMVQVGVIGPSGAVKTCRMHDLMRDLCLSKANEENFLEIVHGRKGNKQVVSHRVRRLAMHGVGDPTYYSRAPKLRSLLFFIKSDCKIAMLHSCKLLSILTFDELYTDGETLMKEIGNLVHLRYLAIKRCWIGSLPSSIGSLRYLETLIVKSQYTVLHVPNVIWKLERLRHLNLNTFQYIGDRRERRELQLGNLSFLQTLKRFDGRVLDIRELVNISNLRNVSIILEDMEELKVILQPPDLRFNHLTSLRIEVDFEFKEPYLEMLLSSCCPNLYKLCLIGKIIKLPEHHQFPPNLTKLTLVRSYLKEDPMTTLEKLPKLEFLCLGGDALWYKKIVCSSKGFPRLKTLMLDDTGEYLEEWRVDKEAMPNLCQLRITGCSTLKMLPDGLKFITTLRELVIKSMSPEFKKRLQVVNEEGDGGEDLYKVKHVPSLVFLD